MELARFRPDRVIAHWCVPSAFPITLGVAKTAELEVVSHGSDVRLLTKLPQKARALVVRQLRRRATRWRFVSEELRTTLEAALEPEEALALRALSEIRAGVGNLRRYEKDMLINIGDDAAVRRYQDEWRKAFEGVNRSLDAIGQLDILPLQGFEAALRSRHGIASRR